jgi:hypothetical protein
MAEVPDFIKKMIEQLNATGDSVELHVEEGDGDADARLSQAIADVREACGPRGDVDTLDPIALTGLMDKLDELRHGPAPEPRKEEGDVPTYSSSVGALRLALKFSQLSGGPGETEEFFALARRMHAFISTTDHREPTDA